MARRRKEKSLLEMALPENWQFSAITSGIFFILAVIVMPGITHPILRPIVQTLKPLALGIAAFFAFIALLKFLRSQSPSSHYRSDSHQPHEAIPWANVPDIQNNPSRNDSVPHIKQQPTEWSLELIRNIEWKRFEELSVAYCHQIGIRAEATSLGADGGIDIKLYEEDAEHPTSIAQCKAWNSWRVGVKEIREFLGVLTHEKIAKGFYFTSGEFTNDAKSLAKASAIELIDGKTLLTLIQQLSEEAQKNLLSVATRGDYTTPTCPSCGIKMVMRSSKRGDFWGCRDYPRCKQKLHSRNKNQYHINMDY